MIRQPPSFATEKTSSSQIGVEDFWWRDFCLFGLSVVFPSIAIFKKVGWVPLAGYVLGAMSGLYILLRHVLPAIASKLSARFCGGMAVASFVLLATALYWVYPQVLNSHGFRLFGIQFGVSDSNDAFVATWKAMFEGKYPYYETSFLGNPISPMPGALLIALPFYVLGWTALQNIVWLVILWMAMGRHFRDYRLASVMMLTVMGMCPNLVYTVLQAGDYMTNSIYVLVASLFFLRAIQQRQSSKWLLFGAAAALGLALSSRANYFLLLPVLFFVVVWLRGFWSAAKHLAVVLAILALVTLPFYLYDPAHFSPLHTTGKMDLGGRFPHAAEVVFFSGCLLASALGFFQRGFRSLESVCARMFVVQEFAVLSGFILASLASRRPALDYAHFALLSMFFGVFAFGAGLFRRALVPSAVHL